jgi:hypothetical protein
MLISGLGLDQDDFEHGEKEKVIEWLGKSPRQLSQTLGTEWGRQIVDKDLWIKVAVRKITQLAKTGFDVVIDDCRFDNEVNAMVDLDAVLVKVTRPQTIEVFPHISERGITLPDELFHRIHNDGTIEQLHEQVDGLLNRLMPGAAI